MSRSTRIDELPEHDYEEMSNVVATGVRSSHNQLSTPNLKMNVKRVSFADESGKTSSSKGMLSNLKSQLNEENVLIILVLIFSSNKQFKDLISKIPFLSSLSQDNFMYNIFYGLILFIILLVAKIFILPMIKI